MSSDLIPVAATDATMTVGHGRPPIIVAPRLNDLLSAQAWLADVREGVRLELSRWGHLLVRGLPVRSPQDFAVVRDALVNTRATYRENATPRSSFGNDVYSSTDLPSTERIALHNENSYTLTFPGVLLFCCLDAPDHGGATTVADVRQVLNDIPPDIVERFRRVGWSLIRNYHAGVGLPWTVAFTTDNPAVVDEYCRQNKIGRFWSANSELCTVQYRSALIVHPATGEELWFNHAAFWSRWSLDQDVREVLEETFGTDSLPFDTAFGDGAPLAPRDVAAINRAYGRAQRREQWQVGDVMIVDNLLSAHGREPYRGSRRVLVAMAEPIALDECSPTVRPRAERQLTAPESMARGLPRCPPS